MKRLFFLAAILLLALANAEATLIQEIEPNDTAATAQNVNGNFSLDSDPNIFSSTTIPHVTIHGSGETLLDVDFFRFTSANGVVLLDVDFGGLIGDTHMAIWNAAGTLLAANDDQSGDPGTIHSHDSFLSLGTFFPPLPPGDYVVALCPWPCSFSNNFGVIPGGNAGLGVYNFHISSATVPEPSSLVFLAIGFAVISVNAGLKPVKHRALVLRFLSSILRMR